MREAISHSGPELSQVPGLRPVSASATGASPVYPSTGTERGFGEPQMNANERRYDQSLFSEHVSEGRRPLAGSVRASQVRSGRVRLSQAFVLTARQVGGPRTPITRCRPRDRTG